jgi:hypothetical protein
MTEPKKKKKKARVYVNHACSNRQIITVNAKKESKRDGLFSVIISQSLMFYFDVHPL